jgi:CNT family concentrative nucleoside transporter
MFKFMGIIGILVFILISYLLSENKKLISPRLIGTGLFLQLIFAFLMLKTPIGVSIFKIANSFFLKLKEYSNISAKTLFGSLVDSDSINAGLAFSSLPLIIFISAIMAVLIYLGIIQFLIKTLAKLFYYVFKITGVEAFTASLLIFMGIETFTGIKKYFKDMNRSQLFSIMTVFMSTIAGSVMAVYVSFGAQAGHLFTASLMSVPAAFIISKIMIPEYEANQTDSLDHIQIKREEKNILEAIANGTTDGLYLALQVGAMLLAFIALIYLTNDIISLSGLGFNKILSYIFYPFALLIGIPTSEALQVGELLGIKTFFNEFIAYMNLKGIIAQGVLSNRSIVITTYALCGFANLGSIGVILGGIKSIAPKQMPLASSLAFKSLLAGTMATFMTASLISIFI